jgi:hypothetical protein
MHELQTTEEKAHKKLWRKRDALVKSIEDARNELLADIEPQNTALRLLHFGRQRGLQLSLMDVVHAGWKSMRAVTSEA